MTTATLQIYFSKSPFVRDISLLTVEFGFLFICCYLNFESEFCVNIVNVILHFLVLLTHRTIYFKETYLCIIIFITNSISRKKTIGFSIFKSADFALQMNNEIILKSEFVYRTDPFFRKKFKEK